MPLWNSNRFGCSDDENILIFPVYLLEMLSTRILKNGFYDLQILLKIIIKKIYI